MFALAALGGSLLVGVSAAPAGALVTVSGHITLYSLSSLGGRDYPYAIAGTPSGDVWFITNSNPLSIGGGLSGTITRITTGGVLDGSDSLVNGGNGNKLNNLATDSSGNAFLNDGPEAEDVPAEVNYSTMSLTYTTTPNELNAVTVSGSTPYWGSSAGEPANELYSGFPTISGTHATVAPVTSMATGTSGEIDMIQGAHDYGFYFGGTLSTCFGSAEQFFHSDSNIVSIASGSAGIWFADAGENSIWQYNGSCEGSEYSIPDSSTPKHITEGSDGNVYFTTTSGIWELIPSTGVFYKYTNAGLNDPAGITLGSDGNIWFTDPDGHHVGKLVPYVASNPYATLHMWTLPTGTGTTPCIPCHWMAVNQQLVPPGYGSETTIGYLFQNPGPGLEALYACTDVGGQGDYLSLDPTGNCADSGVPASGPPPTNLGVQGYVYQSAPTDGTDALQLYQCNNNGTNDWLSATAPPGSTPAGTPPPCGTPGYTFDDVLGYVVNAGPAVPTTTEQCKDGGWRLYTENGGMPFKNQGDCVSYAATGGRNG
jgi:hypothetical protein